MVKKKLNYFLYFFDCPGNLLYDSSIAHFKGIRVAKFSVGRSSMQLLIFLFFIYGYGAVSAQEGAMSYHTLGIENLSGMPSSGTQKITSPYTANKHFNQVLYDVLEDHTHLPEKTKRSLIFKLFAQYEQHHNKTTATVLDATSRQDLNLICGPKSDPSFYIASHLDRTQTQAGAVTLIHRLCTPTDDITLLKERQIIIKELALNKELFTKLSDHLAMMHTYESAILSLWNEDLFYSLLKQEELCIPGAPKLSHWINNNTTLMELNSYTRMISLVGTNLVLAVGATALPMLGIATLADKEQSAQLVQHVVDFFRADAVRALSAPGIALCMLHYHYQSKVTDSAANIIGGPTGATGLLYFGDTWRNLIAFKKCLQTKLIHVAAYLHTIKEIGALTQKNNVLQKHLPLITNLEQELKKLETASYEIRRLFGLLSSPTFRVDDASFFSSYGNIYVTYNLLHNVKNALIPAMVCVGELDAYVSCAQLLRETADNDGGHYCLPHFIEDEQKPYIQAQDFWNPSLAHQNAVTNSLELGGKQPAHIIVTGANAGGKSTTMKGLTLNIICAQSLGIAPAQELRFTPYSSITTYLNITDDIAAGKSHFRAGAARAKELVSRVEETKSYGFSLSAVDEVFNGTTFEEGQAAAYMLIETLGSHPHNTCITVTHFPKVPLLAEKTGTFANYKVSVDYHENGSLARSYKLEPGVSEQKIALHILKEEGFDATFLKKAEEFLLSKKDPQ